jgi:hypothetical protein
MAQVINRHASGYRAVDELPCDTVSPAALAVKPELPVPAFKTVSSPRPLSASATDLDIRPEPFFRAEARRENPGTLSTPVVRITQAAAVGGQSAGAYSSSHLLLIHSVNSNSGML